MFFGVVPQPGDKRKGPPRNQCHSEQAIEHARSGFVHIHNLATESCDGRYAWDTRLLAYQVRCMIAHSCLESTRWASNCCPQPSHGACQ